MLGEAATAILDEYCELTGLQCSSVITVIVLEDLRKRLVRVRHFFEMNTINVYSRASKEPPKNTAKKKASPRKQKTSLPDDFDPPRAISEEAKVDHEKAVRFFKAQAEAKDYKYVDWNKAFALAVNGYLLANFPQIAEVPKIKNL
jgi:hypothetical protein